MLEGQLIEDDDYQDWIQWVEVEENEWITSFFFNPILFVHNSKSRNLSNSIEVSLDGNRWTEIVSRINSILD
jgi:hypothetical protein